jgi:hypothetical protein
VSRTTWAATAVLCLAAAVTACGATAGNTLPVVAGRTDTLIFVFDVLAATRG